jgi:hypothetical protein
MRQMERSGWRWWVGGAALVGGTLLTLFALIAATLPEGCAGGDCTRPERDYPAGLLALVFLALALIASASVGLAVEGQRAGTLGRVGRVGGALAVAGLALLLATIAANLVSEDLPPLFIGPAILALGVGCLLVTIGAVRAGLLPPFVGVLVGVGALAVLGTNDDNWRVILLAPFGLAWVVLGVAVLRARSHGRTNEASAEARS